MKTYSIAPRDLPLYDDEPDHRFEQRERTPCIHRGRPEPSREPRVPQVEYHPGPPYRSMPRSFETVIIGDAFVMRPLPNSDDRLPLRGAVLGIDVASDCPPEARAKLEQWARDFNDDH